MGNLSLHHLLDGAVRVFNRNPWSSNRLELINRGNRRLYSSDGLWTSHAHDFIDDEDFQQAYRRAVRASGWDYDIRWRVHVALWAANTCSSLPGAFAECGTGRGFMASAICEYLGWSDRNFFLFDTFLPKTIDQVTGHYDRQGIAVPVYAEGPEPVAANFAQWQGVQLVIGAIPETLGAVDIDAAAFVHVDMNHPRPEAAAIRHFWPRLASGGMILLDDYGFEGYEESRASADDVANELGFSILSLPTGQGLVVKSAP